MASGEICSLIYSMICQNSSKDLVVWEYKPVFNLEYGNVRGELEKRGGEVALEYVRKVIIAVREAKLPDPRVQGNAGSFFMNPIIPRRQFEIVQQQYPDMPHYEVDGNRVKIPAAWMIDRCGWKGKQIGRAGVHSKQALVLVNCGGATGDEIGRAHV